MSTTTTVEDNKQKALGKSSLLRFCPGTRSSESVNFFCWTVINNFRPIPALDAEDSLILRYHFVQQNVPSKVTQHIFR